MRPGFERGEEPVLETGDWRRASTIKPLPIFEVSQQMYIRCVLQTADRRCKCRHLHRQRTWSGSGGGGEDDGDADDGVGLASLLCSCCLRELRRQL